MGEIVNLRSVKKARARDAAKQAARENRALHGRTSTQKANDQRDAERAKTTLDGLKRENDTPP